MRKIIVKKGEKYGRLTIMREMEPVLHLNGKYRLMECLCDCGKITIKKLAKLRDGETKSCGCLRAETREKNNLKHGYARRNNPISEYRAWYDIKRRCYDKKNKSYKYYGGRGIKICDRWLNSFENFLSDVGFKPSSEHSIDRYPDGNGNYEPKNVRWATQEEQTDNRSNTTWLTHKKRTQSLHQWSKEVKVSIKTLRGRLERGWSTEEVLTTPCLNSRWDNRNKRNGNN